MMQPSWNDADLAAAATASAFEALPPAARLDHSLRGKTSKVRHATRVAAATSLGPASSPAKESASCTWALPHALRLSIASFALKRTSSSTRRTVCYVGARGKADADPSIPERSASRSSAAEYLSRTAMIRERSISRRTDRAYATLREACVERRDRITIAVTASSAFSHESIGSDGFSR